MRSVVVVGASLAGLSAARALRARGFDGTLTVLGEEPHLPYDRPPLSKELLLGAVGEADLALTGEDDTGLDLTWVLGRSAHALLPGRRAVVLDDGSELLADGVVLATGARPRRLPGADALAGVHVLRTLEDSLGLRAELATAPTVVVVGGGFIGAEVASSAHAWGCEVTVVEAMATPLAGPLGVEMGAVVAGLHAVHGVRLVTGAGVARLAGDTRVRAVELSDGTVLPAEVVVVGVGVTPNVEWLDGSGVVLDGGVVTDAACRTSLPSVVAVGDCASSWSASHGRNVRIEHWTHALEQPTTAAGALLLGPEAPPYTGVPYFWSEQYGARIQYAGAHRSTDTVRVVDGDPLERSFAAVYERDGETVAALGMDSPRAFTRLRRELRRRAVADAAAG